MKRGAAPCLFVLIILSQVSVGQVSISAGNSISESFAALSSGSTLPAGWKADNSTSVRTVGTYGGAGTSISLSAGNNMSSSAGNGIYKFQGNGNVNDMAVGGLSSSTASKSVNVYVWLRNTGAASIASLNIAYAVEKYRNGSNAAGFRLQLFYSTNGSAWTSAGNSFLTSFAGDANSNGFGSAPGAVVNVAGSLSIGIAAASDLYLAWNYSVSSGSTTSNAQALGIDDVSIAAVSCVAP